MAEEKKEKPAAAKKPAAKPAAPKAAPAKKEAKPAAAPKAEAKKATSQAADGKVKLTQIQGAIARKWDQQATLKGLGLGKRHRTSVLENTPAVRGMINKVQHLVKVEKVS